MMKMIISCSTRTRHKNVRLQVTGGMSTSQWWTTRHCSSQFLCYSTCMFGPHTVLYSPYETSVQVLFLFFTSPSFLPFSYWRHHLKRCITAYHMKRWRTGLFKKSVLELFVVHQLFHHYSTCEMWNLSRNKLYYNIKFIGISQLVLDHNMLNQ